MKTFLRPLFLLVPAGVALAGQATTPIGSGWANACAGYSYFGSLPNPGDGFTMPSDSFVNCQTNTGAPAGASASNSGVVNGHAFSNSASANAGPGQIKVGATNNGMAAIPFPGGAAYGGWNDQMTITGGSGSAVWAAPLLVQGSLSAVGSGALTRMGVAAYRNDSFLQPYGASINSFAYNSVFLPMNGGASGIRNDAIYFGWDYQGAWFGAVDYGPGDPSNLQNYSLNRLIYFAFPFTYGTPFEIAFYMGGIAGENSSGGSTIANTASFDFTHTVSWAGPGMVIDQNNVVNPNFVLNSQSGFNYNQALVPEPATAGMFVLALASLAWRKRR